MGRIGLAVLAAASLLPLYAQEKKVESNSFVPSNELNQVLPSWMRWSGEYRARWEGFENGGYRADNDDLYLLSRFRINLTIAPTSWLRFVGQGQDARVYWKKQRPAGAPFKDTINLRLAYVELGDMEKRPVSLRVGRQELNFGDQRLVGALNWTNVARAFDAVRGTVRGDGYRVDLFAASVVNPVNGEWEHHTQGNNLHGIYGSFTKIVPKATVEPYLFWRLSPRVTGEAGVGKADFKTTGVRWVGKLPAQFDYNTEVAYQFGNYGPDRLRAWAGHWQLARTLASRHWTPRVIGEYNFASGDGNSRDGRRGTFDILYPTPHDKYALADQVGWRNIHHIRGGVELKPRQKWLIIANYHSWWLADSHDGLYSAAGALVTRVASGTAGRFVGQEVDGQAVYNLNRQVQLSGGVGHIFPGGFLQKATPGKQFTFPYASVQYSF